MLTLQSDVTVPGLDPLWRLYFSKSFARAMDRHAHTEFPMLSNLLQPQAAGHLKPAR